ncbi:FAD-dependent oxidoreductase [Candidatus Gracilibacteria bacterium]|nr:FAD-dependent oxidoreductase [Candidatus Gracilibacteria bacterium]
MGMMQVTLEKKINLTQDVYELHYKLPEPKIMLPGQFVTFILTGIGGRSYSILEIIDDIAILIIKKWEQSDGGRGGSIALCDASVGDEFKVVGPSGHFVLQDNSDNKLFLGTGTGLVPLYNQILEGLKKDSREKYQLVFGVRHMNDMFYTDKFEALKLQYPDRFFYHLLTSRDEENGIIGKGYVTDFLSESVVDKYSEYYICGAPAMIEGCQKRLTELGVLEEKVYFEKYS